MNIAGIDNVLSSGTSKGADGVPKIPGAVFKAVNLQRNASYSGVHGVRTLDPAGAPQSLAEDAVCAIYSMTKLMTSISAMQCVERGLIGLDDDVSTVLTSLITDVLEGFDDKGKPILRKAKNKVTLRLMLCHSSGIGYDSVYPNLIQWRQSRGEELGTMNGSVEQGLNSPLLFEPGEGWAYGAGIDWAGKLVEKLNGGIRLGEYMRKNIWEPLGMTSTTFRIEEPSAAGIKARLADMTMRMPTGELVNLPDPMFPRNPPDDCGGVGSYSCASDYVKVLDSLVRDDGKLLKSATIAEMCKGQTQDPKYLAAVLEDPLARAGLAGGLPEGIKLDYGLGGMVNVDAVPGGRAAGSMQWGGLPNLFWWIDRTNGVYATYFTQFLPTGDPAIIAMMKNLEQAVYSTKESKL